MLSQRIIRLKQSKNNQIETFQQVARLLIIIIARVLVGYDTITF